MVVYTNYLPVSSVTLNIWAGEPSPISIRYSLALALKSGIAGMLSLLAICGVACLMMGSLIKSSVAMHFVVKPINSSNRNELFILFDETEE